MLDPGGDDPGKMTHHLFGERVGRDVPVVDAFTEHRSRTHPPTIQPRLPACSRRAQMPIASRSIRANKAAERRRLPSSPTRCITPYAGDSARTPQPKRALAEAKAVERPGHLAAGIDDFSAAQVGGVGAGFASAGAARGPAGRRGRSLGQLDLDLGLQPSITSVL